LRSRGLCEAEQGRGYEERVVKACEFTSKHGHVIYAEVAIYMESTGIQEFWKSDQNSLRYKQNKKWLTLTHGCKVKMTDPYPPNRLNAALTRHFAGPC
jgi:hypothetical protein